MTLRKLPEKPAVNKTLYIKGGDVEIWDKARELAEDKLSQVITNYLKSFVASKEAETSGFKQKIILQFRDNGDLPTAKAFYGRWLISPDKPYIHDSGVYYQDNYFTQSQYALAITAKGNIVIFHFLHKAKEDGKYSWGSMHIFSTFNEAIYDGEMPADLISLAMEQMGVEVEELDI